MKSAVFLVTLHSPAGHEEGDGEEGEHLMPNVLDGVSLHLLCTGGNLLSDDVMHHRREEVVVRLAVDMPYAFNDLCHPLAARLQIVRLPVCITEIHLAKLEFTFHNLQLNDLTIVEFLLTRHSSSKLGSALT